jgi:zinc protease
MRQCKKLLILILLLITAASAARAEEGKAYKERLPNGMTVIIEEARSAPVVAIQMWVHVGGADETDREAGISHVFEHMLFKGTEKRGVGEIAREIESVGGNINAYTSFDNTVYHLAVPARHFHAGLDIISDAIQHSSFDPGELAKELEVVLEEIRMNEDRPGRNLFNSILSTAYTGHPYRRPVIGSKESVQSLTRKDIIAFFKRWYVPSNMTLVIVGDVQQEAALKIVKGSFRGFEGGAAPGEERSAEPPQKGLRIDMTEMDIAETHFGMAFHIPELKDSDTYAIDVLEGVLGGGPLSRLYKKLKIEDMLVHGISAYAMTLKDPGLFFITGTLEAKKVEEVVFETIRQIKDLALGGPDPDELDRVKLNLESGFIYSRETMQGIARKLGYYETISGDLGYETQYLEGIRGVSADDVRRVIDEYLTPGNMTVSVLLPTKDKGAVTTDMVQSTVREAWELAAEVEWADEGGEVTRVKLDNGITLIVKEVHTNPTVAFYAAFPGGLRFEKRSKNGVGRFTAGMLTRGTRTRTREELNKEVEGMAGGVSGFSGWNSTGASAKFLSKHFDPGLKVFADIIMNATFPKDEIEKLRSDVLASIKRSEDNLPSHTFKLLKKTLYKKHPYGTPTIGVARTVQGLKRRDLLRHYKKFFVPQRMVLTVVGDVQTGYVVKRVKAVFKDFERDAGTLPKPRIEKRPSSIRSAGAKKQKAQTHIAIGFMGTTIGHEDSYTLRVLSEVLSGQGGRLFVNLRDRKSLAYSVSSFSKPAQDPGLFAIYIAVAPEKKAEAIEEIIRELRDISTVKVGTDELKRARNSIIGGYEIGLQRVSRQAANMTNNELYGLGFDFRKEYTRRIEAVTAEDVLRIAQKYIDLDAYTISVVGPNGG